MSSDSEKKRYRTFIEKITPKHNLFLQMSKAFLTGGTICLCAQGILNTLIMQANLEKRDAESWCAVILIAISVLLTGLHIYSKIVKWGGAGALVPITGFANAVASAAIEYKPEGQVFGVGCKIFSIAGPVILFGITASFLVGLIGMMIGY